MTHQRISPIAAPGSLFKSATPTPKHKGRTKGRIDKCAAQTKICEQCENIFSRNPGHTEARWKTSLFCSATCSGKARTKHGETNEKRTREFETWIAIKQRCHNAAGKDYPRYGGRGIIVCERWRNSFELFLADMGRRPSSQHSIDRIENDGNYEPGNCRWATRKEQQRNRSNAVKVDGKSAADLADKHGVTAKLIRERMGRGWSNDRLLDPPNRHARRRSKKDEKYLALIRRLPCISCDADPARVAAHVRISPDGELPVGMGLKPDDRWTLPLCAACHTDGPKAQHKIGELKFYSDLGLDPLVICQRLYSASPDIQLMRQVCFDARNGRT